MAGKRIARQNAAGLPGWAVFAGVLVVLLAGYAGLCAWAGGQNIFPNVKLAGADVSGLTREEAVTVAQTRLSQMSAGANVTIVYSGGWQAEFSAAELNPDEGYAQRAADQALAVGRESFLLQGFAYLRCLFGTENRIPLEMDYAGVEQPKLQALLEKAQDELGSEKTRATYRVEGEQLVMTKGVTDVSIDQQATAQAVYEKLNQVVFPALERGSEWEMGTVDMISGSTPPQDPDYDGIYRELYAEAAEPVYDKQTHTVSEHVVGVTFDPDVLRGAYNAADEGETFSIPLTITQPRDTRESFESKLFANVLGTGQSRVTGSANRKYNVKLSAAACDGVVLLPGEVFAYNETTGSRTEEKGYLPAPTYNAGASVDDVGGGICQTSSTIYYAVLHTPLEIVERHNHSYATGYVPDGMDATVFYGSMDFRFKNSTNYPLKIVTESYDRGGARYLKVTLLGTNEDGRYAVPKENVFEVVEPTTSYLADETVARGTLVLDSKQNAYRGRKAQVTRTVYEKDGTVVEVQDLGVSRYKMRPHLYRYNPLDGDPASWPDGQPPKSAPAVPDPVVPIQPEQSTGPV